MAVPEYDNCGRMKYNPEYHFNHLKPYTTQELTYICKMYGSYGSRKQLSMALGRTEATLATLVNKLKKSGEFDFYKNLDK